MKKEILHEGKFRRFVCENGWEYTECVKGKGVVVILGVTDAGKLIFVEQYRPPIKKHVIEFPAGMTNDLEHAKNETMEEAARREFLEETGYQAQEMRFLTEGPAAQASNSDILVVYRATGLKKVGAGGGDHTEDITVHEIPLVDVDAWLDDQVKKGRMIDTRIYAGLYFLTKENRK